MVPQASMRTQQRPLLRPTFKPLARPCKLVANVAAIEVAAAKKTEFDIPRGETAGAAMVVDNVSIQVGDRDLLVDVDWKLMPGHRVGLVGANGAGKSTLLKCLTGLRQADMGRVTIGPKVEIGYLEQTAVSGSKMTVWEEARSRMTSLLKAEAMMDEAERLLYAGDSNATEMMTTAQDLWEAAGGPTADKKVANVLTGLGFSQSQFDKRASEFSGGWQMRIALARLLLGPAGQSAAENNSQGLLLLDEPTNHLDSAACKWLGNFLKNSSGGLVIVSHDEALLEDACDRIVEVRGKKLHHYVGSYSRFLELREERETQLLATAEKQQAEIAHLQSFVDRFGAKASKATQAQSRMKMIEKLKDKAVEAPAASSGDGPGDAKKVTLTLPRAPACSLECLTVSGGSVGWGEASAPNAKPLLTDIEFVIKRGQRVLVLGPNGAGKSTLIKSLGGGIPLWTGSKKLGDGVKISYFSQDLAQDLPLDVPALDYVIDKARSQDPSITMEKCRQALGAMGLQNSMALQHIGTLSGGEKARVALAAFALVPCNVLLLDEASNHLDAQTINVLTGALQEFQGAIIAITHNMAFAKALSPTHVMRVQNGAVTLDNLVQELSQADFEHKSAQDDKPAKGGKPRGGKKGGKKGEAAVAAAPAKPAAAKAAAPAKAASPAKSGQRQLSWKEQQEYSKLQQEMDKMTMARDKLQGQVANLSAKGDFKAVEKTAMELAKIQEDLDTAEWRFMELADLAGDL